MIRDMPKYACIFLTVFSTFNIFIQVGIQVSCEDLFSGHHWKICHAYATFVTQRKETGERVRVHLILISFE